MSNKTVNHISHKKSVVVENERPKLPTQEQIAYGEIAINYAKDVETMSLKNNSDEIVTRSSDKIIEKKIAEANQLILDGLNGSIVMSMTTEPFSPSSINLFDSAIFVSIILSELKVTISSELFLIDIVSTSLA